MSWGMGGGARPMVVTSVVLGERHHETMAIGSRWRSRVAIAMGEPERVVTITELTGSSVTWTAVDGTSVEWSMMSFVHAFEMMPPSLAERLRVVLEDAPEGTWAIAVTVEFLRDILAELEG